jgi:hypothetical protein
MTIRATPAASAGMNVTEGRGSATGVTLSAVNDDAITSRAPG